MTRLVHNFDGGPTATNLTVANSGQVPGNNPFQGVTAGSVNQQIEYKKADVLERGTAEYVLLVRTIASSDATMIWTTAMGSQTQVWMRMYLYLTATPASNGAVFDPVIFETDNGAAFAGYLLIDKDTRAVNLSNGPETLTISTTHVLPLNDWARVEARFAFSTTVGSVSLKLFLEPDSDTETELVSATGWNTGTSSANSYAFGYPINQANRPEMYISGLELNNTGWPGPAPWRQGKGVPTGALSSPTAPHTFTVA